MVASAPVERLRNRLERAGYRAYYRATALNYAVGVPTPKRTTSGRYWSYELTNGHGDDPGLDALASLPGAAVVFDVGAHVGEHAVPLALDGRTVHAFEPNPHSADRLARNASLNGAAVRLHRVGLGDNDGRRRFYRSTFSKLSAFDRPCATRWGASIAGVDRVPVRRIDSLVGDAQEGCDPADGDADREADAWTDSESGPLPPPDGLKIDVEGAELAVLEGASRTIDRHRPLVVVEPHAGTAGGDPRLVRDWLDARGYEVAERDEVWVCRP